MRTYLRLKNRQSRRLPAAFRDQDVRYADELVASFLQQYTRPGDVVFDPFAGFGTTLLVAEAMGRVPCGVEFDAARVGYIRGLLQGPHTLIHGDARRLSSYTLPPFDFAMTSPPFMSRSDRDDPLSNYGAPSAGYPAYLDELRAIAAQLRGLMKPNARVVLEVANLKDPTGITPLAWDVARAIGQELHFEGEVVVCWDSYYYGYDHSYCLVFGARGLGLEA